MHVLFSFLLLSLSGVPAAMASQRYTSDPAWLVMPNVPYVANGTKEEVADLVLPNHMVAPAVILVHGGGWSLGDKLDIVDLANEFTSRGIAVINVNYRLANMGRADTQWPAQLQDVQAAVRWARSNAKIFHIDPSRICAAGESAGGHLAMFLGFMDKSQPGDRSSQFAKESPHVSCVGHVSGIANFTNPHLKASFLNQPIFGGKSYADAPNLWKAASPIFQIHRGSAPTFTIQGKSDPMVINDMAHELTAALKANHVETVELVINGGHVFQDTPRNERDDAVARMMDFFQRQLGGQGR